MVSEVRRIQIEEAEMRVFICIAIRSFLDYYLEMQVPVYVTGGMIAWLAVAAVQDLKEITND